MIETILTALGSSSVTALILAFLGKTWIQSRVKSSIAAEYKKQFELFSRELDRKEKIELVAEIMAEYLNTPEGDPMSREQRNKLNQLSFKCSLWLPKDIAIQLSKRIQNKEDAISPYQIIVEAREALLESSNSGEITHEHVTIWHFVKENPEEIKNKE
ncbi:MAG: hypothetical protein OEW99_01880 [Gammaproteobacteria bacterium]|nr:hypothetical protein [Gammaproteobacteria bacterium]MDH5660355.1 hypothetical protein [Gammaproteobacteria bacterium]